MSHRESPVVQPTISRIMLGGRPMGTVQQLKDALDQVPQSRTASNGRVVTAILYSNSSLNDVEFVISFDTNHVAIEHRGHKNNNARLRMMIKMLSVLGYLQDYFAIDPPSLYGHVTDVLMAAYEATATPMPSINDSEESLRHRVDALSKINDTLAHAITLSESEKTLLSADRSALLEFISIISKKLSSSATLAGGVSDICGRLGIEPGVREKIVPICSGELDG